MNDFIQNISPIQTIAVLLVITIITHIVLGSILKQITKHSGSTKTQIDDYLISAISAPLKLLIWYGWLYFSLKELTFLVFFSSKTLMVVYLKEDTKVCF